MEMARIVPQSEIVAKDRLILALDMPIAECKEIINELGDLCSIVKINYSHFLEMSTSTDEEVVNFLAFLREKGINVFYDLKFDDIDTTVEAYIRELSKVENIQFCTIHGNSSLMKAAMRGKNGKDKPKILIVTLLTSLDEHDLKDIFNNDKQQDVEKLVVRRAIQAHELELDGVIASGLHAKKIKQATNDEFLIVSPGISLTGLRDDHKRVTTPEEAIENGSDYLVIGRPIYQSANPVRTTIQIIKRMQNAFDSKYSQ